MMHELRELPTGALKAISYDIRMNKMQKIERVVIHEIASNDENEVHDYLVSMGVEAQEVDAALNFFDEMGHNVASFGVMGGLVGTEFEGVVQ